MECFSCRQVKPDVRVMPDPYDADVNDTIVMTQLCGDCERERLDDI